MHPTYAKIGLRREAACQSFDRCIRWGRVVKLSAKVEYACIAMMELAHAHESGKPVRLREIGAQNGIPSKFLVQLLIQLKNAGYVASTRGAGGGYQLAQDPHEITLADVLRVIDGQGGASSSATMKSPCVTALIDTWQELSERHEEMLKSVTIADLADRARRYSGPMFYI